MGGFLVGGAWPWAWPGGGFTNVGGDTGCGRGPCRPRPWPFSVLGSSSLGFTSSPSPFSSSSPENVEDSGLDSPSHAAPGPSPESWVPRPGTPQSPPACRTQHPEARGPTPRAPSPGPWGPEAGAGELEPRVSLAGEAPGGGLPRWDQLMVKQRPWGRRVGAELARHGTGVSSGP